MKVTKSQLKQIILEELAKVLNENWPSSPETMRVVKPGPVDTYKNVAARTRAELMQKTASEAASGGEWPTVGDRTEYPKKGVWWQWEGDKEGWVHHPTTGMPPGATGSPSFPEQV